MPKMNKINACLEHCSVLLRTKPCQIAFAFLYNYRRTTNNTLGIRSGPMEFLGNSNAATKCFNSFQTGEYQEILKNIFCCRSEIEPFVNKEIFLGFIGFPEYPLLILYNFVFKFIDVFSVFCQTHVKQCANIAYTRSFSN